MKNVPAYTLLLTMLPMAALLASSMSARATVACSFKERKLGSYILASELGEKIGSCGRWHPAYVMDSSRRRLMSLGEVASGADFQFLEDRYLFWNRGSVVQQADLLSRTSNVVFDAPPGRGTTTYTASPRHARVALVAKGLVTWVPVTAKPASAEHVLYSAEMSADVIRPLAWSGDERTYWFCSVQYPSHHVRIVAGTIDGPSFTSGWLDGEIPACTSATRAFNITQPENFDANRGYLFRFTYEPGPPPLWHIWLHDVFRDRVAELGETKDLYVRDSVTGTMPAALFQPDGSCRYKTAHGREHVADCTTLFSSR